MGPGSHDDTLEVAVWIGVVVVGLAVLAFLEVLRSNSFIGAHRGEIWMALPTVALCALASIAGAGAVLFFFRFFLGRMSHVVAWPYLVLALAAIFAVGHYLLRQRTAGPDHPNGFGSDC